MQTNVLVQAMYYPYTASSGVAATCMGVSYASPAAYTVNGNPYVSVAGNNAAMQSAILIKPIVVAIDGSTTGFQ